MDLVGFNLGINVIKKIYITENQDEEARKIERNKMKFNGSTTVCNPNRIPWP